jgi:hypothetical protein
MALLIARISAEKENEMFTIIMFIAGIFAGKNWNKISLSLGNTVLKMRKKAQNERIRVVKAQYPNAHFDPMTGQRID